MQSVEEEPLPERILMSWAISLGMKRAMQAMLELEVSVSQASLFDDEMLRRFVLFANVLVFKK